MKALLQRVREAHVEVDGTVTGAIGTGLLILLGVSRTDSKPDAEYLSEKIAGLRIFPDAQDRMNRSVTEIGGSVLVVSQFTLYGDCRRGRRPSFDEAASPEQARALYEYFVERLRAMSLKTGTGVFQASMQVFLVNDGPVTLLVESKQK